MRQTATVDEMQQDFAKYLDIAEKYGEVVVLHEGKPVARLVAESNAEGSLTDSLCGVLKRQYTEEDAQKARMMVYEEN